MRMILRGLLSNPRTRLWTVAGVATEQYVAKCKSYMRFVDNNMTATYGMSDAPTEEYVAECSSDMRFVDNNMAAN